jgi:hypothetical protein
VPFLPHRIHECPRQFLSTITTETSANGSARTRRTENLAVSLFETAIRNGFSTFVAREAFFVERRTTKRNGVGKTPNDLSAVCTEELSFLNICSNRLAIFCCVFVNNSCCRHNCVLKEK